MQGIDDNVDTLATQSFSLVLNERCKLISRLEINILNLVRGYRRVAVADSTDNSDLNKPEIDSYRRLAVINALVCFPVVDIYTEEGELRRLCIFDNRLLAPIILVVAERHCRKVKLVHPFCYYKTTRQI